MPLAYQQTWQNGSAKAVARRLQRQQQQPRQLTLRQQPQQLHIHRHLRPLRRQLRVEVRRLLRRQQLQPLSQDRQRRHHQELALRQHRAFGGRRRLVHSAHIRFAVRSARLRRLYRCGWDASHRDAATAAFYLLTRQAIRCDRRWILLASFTGACAISGP
jgi:hypothetical protein